MRVRKVLGNLKRRTAVKVRGKRYKTQRVHVKELAKVLGTLQSLKLATGPLTAVMTRALYSSRASALSWNCFVKLDRSRIDKVEWWHKHIRSLDRYPIDSSRAATPIAFEVASNASAISHFLYIVNGEKTMLASRAFSEEERKESSTWRELTAFKDTWTNPDILKRFEGTGIVHYTDNEAVVHVLAKGSRNA